MRLTIPEPKIDLYTDGFAVHDKLSRKPTGDKLSELVERIDDPLVIALDGAWGSGKSFFLKCWVGEHLKREGNITQTVYFDAFKHDFLDDPLIALTGAIAGRFEDADDETAQKAWNKAKRVAPALGRAIVRAGVSVATAGLVNKADELADAAIETASRELDGAVAEFWKRENEKRAAMESFRQALVDLTEPDEQKTPSRKLIVVIDELDRCRPDYALALLEVIKHFFKVDGVHFVLGANLNELENSVRKRYGGAVAAAQYLQKFISITVNVPQNQSGFMDFASVQHYRYVIKSLGTGDDWRHLRVLQLLELMPRSTQPSLRDIEKIAACIAISPDVELRNELEYTALAVMTLLSVTRPELFRQTLKSQADLDELLNYFSVTERDGSSVMQDIQGTVFWICQLTQKPEVLITNEQSQWFSSMGLDNNNKHMRRKFLQGIHNKTLALFRLPR
ncbi:KAP family P-loop NTPase fold protein [Ruegeria faecimaris]|uniref:KAP family P-loop domain-containing protein n=1 Tax=Ruegeria faecimaris TaxID=686389 RepID=A0A521CAL9_9RHOB|nr:P-loop NTPase fold protein [Ruegeria faecimaris]SMO55851.1 KAP family P-loop domain-containing protein [Ruegeria faecimaris]